MAKRKRRQPTRRAQDAPKTGRPQKTRIREGKRWRGVLTVAIFLGLGLVTLGLWRGWSQPVRPPEKTAPRLTSEVTQAVSQAPLAVPQYVGGEACRGCHMEQFQQWQDSHHAQAMELAPDNARYAFVYAVALPDTGALQRGIEALEHMLQRQPDNGKLVSALINWSLEQRDYARAKQYMSHFEQPHPNDAALMQWR